MTDFELGPLGEKGDADAFLEVIIESFRFPREVMPRWLELVGAESVRVVRRGPRVVAGLVILDVGQWFGGKLLPMGAIAAVGVAPDVRGSGVGKALMAGVVRELHDRGVLLSALYASTQVLYRSVGYEQAGSVFKYAAPARVFPAGDRTLPAHRVDPDRLDAAKALRHDHGRTVNGYLERNEALWAHVMQPFEGEAFAYVVGAPDAPEGLLLYRQTDADDGFNVDLRDFFATTPRGWSRLCTLLGDLRSRAGEVRWDGPPGDPRLLLLTEQEFRVAELERFMLRIVDVPGALAARGYPEHLTEVLALTVDDPLIPENTGTFTLKVAGGAGTVECGGEGDLHLDVRALAPLFSGLLSATALAGIGRLSGSAQALAVADRLFAGQEPTMTDHF